MLRIGIAGVGGLGTVHLKTFLNHLGDKVTVEALADPIEKRRSGKGLTSEDLNLALDNDSAVSLDNVRSYHDYTELCRDEQLDVVCIAMPSDLHSPAAILAMENGKHVFTEKPMALTPEDCQRMIDASRANGKTLMVGQCLRFFPEYVEARRIMQSGAYGKPLTAVMNRYGGTPKGWFADSARSGGVNLDLHIHDIDTALLWWGDPDKITSQTKGHEGTATSVLSQWHYDDGPVAQIEASWDAGSGFAGVFRIVLEKATLTNSGGLKITTAEGSEMVDLSGQLGGHAAELVYFIQCVIDGTPVERCPPEESLLAVKYALGQV